MPYDVKKRTLWKAAGYPDDMASAAADHPPADSRFIRVYHLLPSNYVLDDIRERRIKLARVGDLNDLRNGRDQNRRSCDSYRSASEQSEMKRVRYPEKRAELKLNRGADATLSDETKRALLVTKCSEWRHEREQRMFLKLLSARPIGRFHFKVFDADLQFAEVILGPDCSQSLASVRQIVRAHVPSARTYQARFAWKHWAVVPKESSIP